MYFGYQSIGEFSFITIGFYLVMIGALGFGITFLIGRSNGGRAALRFTRRWAAGLAASILAVILFAFVSGQWRRFLIEFGPSPLVEIGVLAGGWILIMWFMATQYALGRIDLDDTYGIGNKGLSHGDGDETKALTAKAAETETETETETDADTVNTTETTILTTTSEGTDA